MYSAGHTYSNLSRLFLRLFTGVMFLQFGIRQWIHFGEIAPTFIDFMGMGQATSLALMITVETVCSTLIILGFLSRLAIIPPFVAMVVAEDYILGGVTNPALLFSTDLGYVPVLFIGIFIFMLLAGPGKISLDYLISIHITPADKEVEDVLQDA